MSEVKHKVISKNGGLTIPATIRREHNAFLGGEAVDMVIEDGKLVISKHTPICMFCRSIESVGKFRGREICKDCVTAMVEVVVNNEEDVNEE